MGREDYIAYIVNIHHIHYEAKAPEREQRIAQTCASYASRNPELMDEIYNSDGDASDGDANESEASSVYLVILFKVWNSGCNPTSVLFYRFCNERRESFVNISIVQ